MKWCVRQVFALVLVLLMAGCASMGGTGAKGGADNLSLEKAIDQSAEEIGAELPKGTRVAIAAFSSEHENLSNYIMDELAGALTDGNLEVADRRNLAYVYKELNFQMSGDVSDETAVSIGKFLGAKYVITGQFIKAGDRYRYRLAGINVETAVQESSTRLNVTNGRSLKSLIADVRQNKVVAVSASYGDSAQGKTAGAHLDRGILFATRNDFEMAIAEFTEALNLDPDLSAAYMLRGRALFASVSKVISMEDDFSSFSSYNTGGKASPVQQQAFDRATADFTQAIKLDPNNAIAYSERGRAFSNKGDQDKAIADFTQAIKIAPNSDAFYTNRGIAYSNKGDYDRAIADYTQALRLDPNNATAYYNRGNAYNDDKGDYDRALTDYTQAIRLDPNDASAYYNRGNAYASTGDLDLAIADYTQAIRIDPNHANAYTNRGLAYYFKQDYDRTIADYTQAIRINPNYAYAYSSRGDAYAEKKDYDRAIADYTQAIRLDPNDATAYVVRGYAYYDKGDYDLAIADYTQAIRLDPNDAYAYNNRGIAYNKKGDRPHARADWTKALEIDPNNQYARSNLEQFK
ncbi:tetratricopeptide repeat protein [Treponema primitia]|uniref:tetratricopeptide repeat protein n=1 Tax=Treponema primitia TaxID=88058 RepID=UPI0039812DB6